MDAEAKLPVDAILNHEGAAQAGHNPLGGWLPIRSRTRCRRRQ
jgi:hypothetical protein